MKIAIVHDQLLIKGGAERVFLAMADAFPDANLYTLTYRPATTYSEFSKYKINTSILNHLIGSNRLFRYFFPLSIFVMRLWRFKGYDLVITSSATVAKYVHPISARHYCYCYFPTRAIWNSKKYFGKSVLDTAKRTIIGALRRYDFKAAQGVDQFITLSENSRTAIRECYGRDAHIIPSPIELERFRKNAENVTKGRHFLIVSRLEKWKTLEYAIEAFNLLGLPLRVVGDGAEAMALEKMAQPNIKFLGEITDDELINEYASARAIVFTPELEYGLVPIEANACNTPVIAYGVGGVCETMIPWQEEDPSSEKRATALFFHSQTAEALCKAVKEFEKVNFHKAALQKNAERFSKEKFQLELCRYILN